MGSLTAGRQRTPEQLKGGRTDHQRIGRRDALQAGGQIGGLAQRQLFLPGTTSYLPHDDQAGVDAQARRQALPLLLQMRIELSHGFDRPESPARTARWASSSCAKG